MEKHIQTISTTNDVCDDVLLLNPPHQRTDPACVTNPTFGKGCKYPHNLESFVLHNIILHRIGCRSLVVNPPGIVHPFADLSSVSE